MKDLYGLSEQDVLSLQSAGLVPEDALISADGKSKDTGEPVFWINFPNSEEKQKAYDFLYGGRLLP